MTSCDPNENTLNPPRLGPPPVIPGFGSPFAPLQDSFPDIKLPINDVPEDVIDLINRLFLLLPGGATLKPNLDSFYNNNLLSAISSLFNEIAPFLALYSFFQPMLNMVLCILDVICSLIAGAPKAAKRLFKKCIPQFLSLFPWMAIPAMLLALLLLLLALIEYIINMLISYINDIIENIKMMAEAVQYGAEEDIIATAEKIAHLLCMIDDLFALFVAVQAVFQVIQALAEMVGRSVCSKARSGDDGYCCTDDICPGFIAYSPDGLSGISGQLIYHKTIDYTTTGFSVPPVREERWQFIDAQTQPYNFSDIVTPIGGNIFWPTPNEYGKTNPLNRVPYNIDLRMELDPSVFGHTDTGGTRYFRVKNSIVSSQPYIGWVNYAGGNEGPYNGTLPLIGGLVYEDDLTPYIQGGRHLTLDQFVVQPATTTVPSVEDGYFIDNIEYTLNINHTYLVKEGIISLFCSPELSQEQAIIDATFDISSVASRVVIPDVGATVACLQNSLNEFRKDVSLEKAVEFSAASSACLEALRSQTTQSYIDAFITSVSPYHSLFTVNPDLQFLDLPVVIKFTPKDANGTLIGFSIPEYAQPIIAEKIVPSISFGSVGVFTYDGKDSFVANINSSEPGDGDATLSFNGNQISEIINRDNEDPTAISPIIRTYEFIGIIDDASKPRRNEGDS